MARSGRNGIRHSAIIRALSRFSDKCAEKASNSFFARILCGYFSLEKTAKESFFASLFSRRGAVSEALNGVRDGVCDVFTNNPLKKKFTSFLIDLLYIRTRDIGIYLFAAGLYSIIEYFIIKYAVRSFELDISVLIGGAFCAVLSLLFFSGRSLASTFNKNRLHSFVVFDLIGADRKRLVPGEVRIRNAAVALLLGMVTGVLSFLMPPHRVVLCIICISVLCVVFFTPESGAVLILTLIPFLPLGQLLILCGVTCVSYLFKVIRKKRELRIGPLDAAVILLAALTLFGKLITVSRSGTDSLYLIGISAYFICRNLLCKREWLDRALHAAATSSAVVGWFGLLFYFCGTPAEMLAARSLLAGAGGEMSVFFGSSSVFACYLILTAPLLLYFALGRGKKRAAYLLSFAASLTALLLTGRLYAVFAFIIAVTAVLMICSRRTLVFAVPALPTAVLAAVFLPEKLYLSAYEKLCTENAIIQNVWSGVGRMISASPLGGYGIGSFGTVYPAFASAGYGSAGGAKSVYLQLFSEGGVMLAVVFTACLLLFFSFCLSAAVKCGRTDVKRGIFAPLTAVLCASLYGLTENIFSSEIILILTFALIGCGAASAEMYRRDHEDEMTVMSWQEV